MYPNIYDYKDLKTTKLSPMGFIEWCWERLQWYGLLWQGIKIVYRLFSRYKDSIWRWQFIFIQAFEASNFRHEISVLRTCILYILWCWKYNLYIFIIFDFLCVMLKIRSTLFVIWYSYIHYTVAENCLFISF